MKNTIKLGTFLLSLFILTACSKNEDTKISSTEQEITTSQIENKANKLDYVGELHNKMMDYFATNVDKSNNKLNIEDFVNVYTKFARENKINFDDEQRMNVINSYNQMREMMGAQQSLANIQPEMCKRFPALCNLTGTGPYNPNPINFLSEGSGNSYQSTLNYIAAIKDIEDKVLKSKEINDKDLEAILSFYSVARHSAAYWHNVEFVQKEKSYWYNKEVAEAAKVRPCVNCNVVNADIAGAVVGSLGGPIGSLGGAAVFSIAAKNFGWRWF